MHQHRLHCIAGGRALHLGVETYVLRQFEVGKLVYVGVAHAFVMFDDGDGGFFHYRPDERLTAARDDDVNVFVRLEQAIDGLAVNYFNDLDAPLVKPGLFQRRGKYFVDGDVGVDGLLPAAQDDRVARLQT